MRLPRRVWVYLAAYAALWVAFAIRLPELLA